MSGDINRRDDSDGVSFVIVQGESRAPGFEVADVMFCLKTSLSEAMVMIGAKSILNHRGDELKMPLGEEPVSHLERLTFPSATFLGHARVSRLS